MNPQFLVIGWVVADLSEQGDVRPGGTAFYAARAAAALGLKVGVAARPRPDLDLGLWFKGIDLHIDGPPATCSFQNLYRPDGRVQFAKGSGHRLTLQDIPPEWQRADIVLLGPVAEDVDPSLAQAFSGSLVGVTPQGWMRIRGTGGRIRPKSWRDADKVLSHVEVMVISPEDVGFREDAIARYASLVPVLVVTQGERGARVHAKGEWREAPAFPTVARDATGAGDVFAAAYLIHYHDHQDPFGAARFANAAASLWIERPWVWGMTREEVDERLRSWPT